MTVGSQDARPEPTKQKPHTGNLPAGKLRVSRVYYERTMRALGKEPKNYGPDAFA